MPLSYTRTITRAEADDEANFCREHRRKLPRPHPRTDREHAPPDRHGSPASYRHRDPRAAPNAPPSWRITDGREKLSERTRVKAPKSYRWRGLVA